MKKYIFLLLLLPVWVSAQNTQIVEATSGKVLSGQVSAQFQYLLPEFTEGEVYYKARNGRGMLNYNMLVGEMQFLENNQVMALTNVKDVLMVNIDNRKFYPFKNNEFAEELLSTGKCQLRVKRSGSFSPQSKKSAYGMETSSANITSVTSMGTYNKQLTVNEKVLINVRNFYYLVGTNGKYHLIKNVQTFTKQFPEHREQIEEFVIEQKTRYNNEDDLKALLDYCSKL